MPIQAQRRVALVAAPHATRPPRRGGYNAATARRLGVTGAGRRRQRVATTHLPAAPLLPPPPRAGHTQDSALVVHEFPFGTRKIEVPKTACRIRNVRFFKEGKRHLFRRHIQSGQNFSELDFARRRHIRTHAQHEKNFQTRMTPKIIRPVPTLNTGFTSRRVPIFAHGSR